MTTLQRSLSEPIRNALVLVAAVRGIDFLAISTQISPSILERAVRGFECEAETIKKLESWTKEFVEGWS